MNRFFSNFSQLQESYYYIYSIQINHGNVQELTIEFTNTERSGKIFVKYTALENEKIQVVNGKILNSRSTNHITGTYKR